MNTITRMTSKTVHTATFSGTVVTFVDGTHISEGELINLRGGGTLYTFFHPVSKAQFTARYVNKVPAVKYLEEGWVVVVAAQAPTLVLPLFKDPVGTVFTKGKAKPVVDTSITIMEEDVPDYNTGPEYATSGITIPMPTRLRRVLENSGWTDEELIATYKDGNLFSYPVEHQGIGVSYARQTNECVAAYLLHRSPGRHELVSMGQLV